MTNEIIPVINKIKIQITQGDIARFPSQALIAPINSSGMWFGAIDGVIERNCGNQFHNQAQARMPLRDGEVVIARKLANHKAAFGDVIFVIDDVRRPLREILFAGLKAADDAGYTDVSLPAMRMGVMLGVYEKTLEATIAELAHGSLLFTDTGPKQLNKATFVIYNDPKAIGAMQKLLDCREV